MSILRTTGLAAGLIASGTLIGASLSTMAAVWDWSSTTPASNATADPNINWAEGMLPSAVNDSARATMTALSAFIKDQGGLPNLGGAGNAFAVSLSQPMTSWRTGLFGFRATRSNTGPVTMSVDGLSPLPLRNISGTDLSSGQIRTGALYLASYSNATSEVLLIGKLAISASDFAPVAASTVKANITGGTSTPSDVSLASFFGAAPAGSIPVSALASTGFAGEIRMFVTSCPTGWVPADGSAGGIVDMRGVFPRGLDNGRGIDPGRTIASFQADQLLSHNHVVTDPGHIHSFQEAFLAAGPSASVLVPSAGGGTTVNTNSSTTGITINNTGGSENRPKNVAVQFCEHL
jgi:hypothetical protein